MIEKSMHHYPAALLAAMWGGSGLPYAMNSALAGDGTYKAVVTVGVPTFGRNAKNVELWREPTTAISNGKLVQVSEPTH